MPFQRRATMFLYLTVVAIFILTALLILLMMRPTFGKGEPIRLAGTFWIDPQTNIVNSEYRKCGSILWA